jgi:hypothetical protein
LRRLPQSDRLSVDHVGRHAERVVTIIDGNFSVDDE